MNTILLELKDYSQINLKITQLELLIQSLEEDIYLLSSIPFDKIPASTKTNKLTSEVEQKALGYTSSKELILKYKYQKKQLALKKLMIDNALKSLNAVQFQIIDKNILQKQPLAKVSEDLGYSYVWTKKLKKQALLQLSNFLIAIEKSM